MSNAKHTPGPWYLGQTENGWTIYSKPPLETHEGLSVQEINEHYKSRIVNDVCGFNWRGTKHEANARLLVAAPEMLEALEKTQAMMKNLMVKGNVDWGKTFCIDFGLMNEALLKIDAAIAKAKGGV